MAHGKITVTEKKPGKPGEAINPGKGSANYPDGTDKASLGKDVVRTITYKMTDGSKAPEGTSETLHFTASKVIDKVTGQVLETTWSGSQDFTDVYSPVVKGYTPDQKVVSDKGITHDAEDINREVTYSPVDQKAAVTYIDDTTGKNLKVDKLKGVTNAKSGYTTKSSIDTYTGLGYTLVSDDTNGAEVVFDNDNAVDQAYTVHLAHGKITVTEKKPGKQTVTYVYKDKDGKVVKTKTVEQDTTFTGKTIKDEVTGETTTTWDQKDHKYTEVTTPVEPGYTADKKSVGGETVTPDDPNRSYTVVYTPNGSIVPVDPNGNPIPNTPSVPYETDPKDPTKVVDGKVPEVPSWTPKKGKPGDPVVPKDPSKDTKVPYDHTKTPGETTATGKVPEVPSWTPKKGKPGDPVKPSDPTKDTKVPYDHTITPGKTTTTGKEEGLPEKPAKSAKAPAEKLVKTPVKAPKAVKTAEPAKTISIKESAQAQDQLPQTGEDNSKAAFGLGLASILGGIGILGAFKRKKKDN